MTREPATPAGTELLDARSADPATARTVLTEVGRTNALFGGHAAVRYGLSLVADALPSHRPVRVLDVGAGGGDVLAHVQGALTARGMPVEPVALDHLRTATAECRRRGFDAVCADWAVPPLAAGSADLVIANLVLHHLSRAAVPVFLAQLDRLAGRAVVITDLTASRLAGLGLRAAGAVLRFHPDTVGDGVVSLRRGFTPTELTALLAGAGIHGATVRRRPGWRIVAAWKANP